MIESNNIFSDKINRINIIFKYFNGHHSLYSLSHLYRHLALYSNLPLYTKNHSCGKVYKGIFGLYRFSQEGILVYKPKGPGETA